MGKRKKASDHVRQLPSGSWQVRKRINGKDYTKTIDHKPTLAEVERIVANLHERAGSYTVTQDQTFERAIEQFMQDKRGALSPSTLRGYAGMRKQIPAEFMHLRLGAIETYHVQRVINNYRATHSAKSTKNLRGFICEILAYYPPHRQHKINVQDDVASAEDYIPTHDDCAHILTVARGCAEEIPLWLAAFGLRRSESCALTREDLVRDDAGWSVRVTKGLVLSDQGTWETKTTKTSASVRVVHVSDYLAELILQRPAGELLYPHNPNGVYKRLCKLQDALGIPHFTLHKMRHYFASDLHERGATDAEIMAAGGWKTDAVMKRVYRHANQSKVSAKLVDYAGQFAEAVPGAEASGGTGASGVVPEGKKSS